MPRELSDKPENVKARARRRAKREGRTSLSVASVMRGVGLAHGLALGGRTMGGKKAKFTKKELAHFRAISRRTQKAGEHYYGRRSELAAARKAARDAAHARALERKRIAAEKKAEREAKAAARAARKAAREAEAAARTPRRRKAS